MNEEKMDELLRLMRAVVPDTSDMSDAGRVGFVYRQNYDPDVQYEELDVVKFGMSLWTPKAVTIGNQPPDQSQEGQENVEENDFWVMFLPGALGSDYVKKTDLSKAPTETEAGKPGINYPDGKTITIDENGMIKGAPPGKQLTQEEMNEQIASGELNDGDVVYLTGPAAGENGLLVKVDRELKDSVNPVQNRVIKNALDRLEALIEETNALRATLETFGLSKISESETVTDADSSLVLSAKEKNSSIEGTLANGMERIKNRAFQKSLPYLGILSAEEENSPEFFQKYYEEIFGPHTSHNDILPYSFMGPNHIIIGYQTSNGYGTQLKFGHYQQPSWRSIYGQGVWSEWRTLQTAT